MKRAWFTLLLAPLVLAVFGPARADNWPQWRGPNHDGVSKEANLPTAWGEGKNVLWKFPMPGLGSSTPIVWGERIFVTSEDGKDTVLLCISTEGKELWKRKLGKAHGKYRGDEGDNAGATPSTDGKHVWTFVGSGEVACHDFSGAEVWKFNAQDRYDKFNIAFGMHSTPVLHKGRLYLQLLHTDGGTVAAVDKATGKQVWKVDRKSDARAECKHSYASPCLWQKGADAYLITHGNDYAVAHRLTDGAEIWRVGGLNPKDRYRGDLRFVASPVATPDLIIVPSAKNHGVVALMPGATGLVMPGSRFEQWRLPQNTPDVPCPLVHGGIVYLCGEGGLFLALDAKTGKPLYPRERLHAANYRGSPVYGDGKVYCTARDGTVTVVKAGPKFERLAVNKLPDVVAASPAVANGRIYLRGRASLYCIGNAAR